MEQDKIANINDELLDDDFQKDRYLAFKINEENYVIEIKYVVEIIGIQGVTQVPNVADYIKGIINIRGNIIPVVEIRMRFGLETVAYTDKSCIVVVEVNNTSIGLIVDEVREVVGIPEKIIVPPPATIKGSGSKYISGMGKIGDTVYILLGINELLYDKQPEFEHEEHFG